MAVQVQCNSSSDPFCYEEGSGPFALIIIPSLLALSTLIVVSQIIWSFVSKRLSSQTSSDPTIENGEPVTLNTESGPVHDSLGPWEIPAHCVLEGVEVFQTGRYGPICKGQLKQENQSTAVVIKTLKDRTNQHDAKEFVDLVLFHSAGRPDNLQSFSERSVYMVAKQVATGLDYLHSYHRILHGDVAARNMLIGSGFSVKVSGLNSAFKSRQTKTVDKELQAKVPVKWQSPERIMRLPVTDRSDVWSFGILLYELTTLGSPPYPDLEPSEVLPHTLAHYRIKRPDNCGAPLYDLIKYCCMWNFKDRPVYSGIMRLLDSYIHLTDTKALCSEPPIDICEYKRKAGLS
ncbi:tyrosine-protein kinase STYK1 isoform X2 [Triplophysa dalaica]|uniref:tyrosine-protein kinase STYK1 isoform X2 n=1 Tax=Triplophysa dalaica TaxID=1582913 RepID=UPI0024E013C1|nr:tyrosine-protein kinase STYK1 isoform X2 [Triplophysa dalaica]